MYAIFVVETKSNNKDSDYIYIKAVAEKWGKGINKMSSVYMDGKTNYCKVEKKINGLCNRYKVAGNDDEIRVFLCIDVDNITNSETAIANRELNRKIQNYCGEKKFELIWFYEDIEEVFWGHKVHDREKIKKAQDFLRTKQIEKIQTKKLNCKQFNELKKKTSNILTVLNEN